MGNASTATRVVTYNVQRWKRLDAIVETLAQTSPDVLCLHEVCATTAPDALDRVADACGMANAHFFGHVREGRYGNAILTRRPSTLEAEWRLAGGSTIGGVAMSGTHRIVRGALVVALDSGVHVACTHLDHISEDERRTQARGSASPGCRGRG